MSNRCRHPPARPLPKSPLRLDEHAGRRRQVHDLDVKVTFNGQAVKPVKAGDFDPNVNALVETVRGQWLLPLRQLHERLRQMPQAFSFPALCRI